MESATVTIATLVADVGKIFTAAIGWAGTVGEKRSSAPLCC